MKRKRLLPLLALSALVPRSVAQMPDPMWLPDLPFQYEPDDAPLFPIHVELPSTSRHWTNPLTDDDYKQVADSLGVEPAAIKAVVEIETGRKFEGFADDGRPVINFDLSIYRQQLAKHGLSITAAQKAAPTAFKAPDVRKYGSRQAAQWARLEAALEFDEETALESVFWGMFQIGGFNWKLLGKSSVREFVELMSRSEQDQLELFAEFCRARNLVRYIRAKDWAAFSLRYNGPGFEAQNYHGKMAAAYARHRR